MINKRKLIPLFFVLTALLALPAVASAGDVEPTPPVETSIKISFAGLHHGAVLTGSGWKVNGTVSKYVAGQTVRVRVMDVDVSRNRIGLSLLGCGPNPSFHCTSPMSAF